MNTHKKSTKMASIEAARAFAAISVVLMHCANAMRVDHFSGHVGLNSIFDFGYVGVDFFFVLSGFIITFVHFKEIGTFQNIPRYLWRRFSRIYPIYWTFLLLSILLTTLARLATGKGFIIDMGLNDIAGTVFLFISEGEPKYIGPAWSLQYEVIFYAIFCCLLISGRVGSLLFITWATLLLGDSFSLFTLDLPFNLDSPHCFQFLCGVAVGWLARRHPLKASIPILVGVLLIFIAGVIFEVYGPFERHSGIGRIVLGISSAFILATLVGLENNKALHTPNWLSSIGSVSYSIYLGHILFINITFMILVKIGLYHVLPEILVFSIAIVVALTVTILIGMYVELPIVNKLKHFNKQRQIVSEQN
jgi:peptidoglycan/LPS O-acetylase OafA/YrhL